MTALQNIPDAKIHTDRRPQVNVRHGRKERPPISLRAIAEHVRSELVAEMVSFALASGAGDGDSDGGRALTKLSR